MLRWAWDAGRSQGANGQHASFTNSLEPLLRAGHLPRHWGGRGGTGPLKSLPRRTGPPEEVGDRASLPGEQIVTGACMRVGAAGALAESASLRRNG